jgi:hypothetical protein
LDKAFIADGFDFSGVGRPSSGTFVTMISPSYFLTATHVGVGGTATFQPTNTLGAGQTYTIDPLFSAVLENPDDSGSDLYLGRLTTPVANNITIYPIAMIGSESAYIGQTMFVYGKGGGIGTDLDRVGRNTIDSLDFFEVDGAGTGQGYISFYDQPTGGVGDDESLLVGGDSGAPNFLVVDGQLALVGINWFTGYLEEDPEQLLSGGSFIPFYAGQLQPLMGSETVTYVPEPASLMILLACIPVLARRRT